MIIFRVKRFLRQRRVWVPLAFLVGGASFIVVFHSVDLHLALQALRNAKANWLVLAVLVNCVTIISQGLRLQRLVSSLAPLHPQKGIEAVALGFFGSNLMPLRGGEVFKLHVLRRTSRISISTGLGIVTIENLFNLVGLLLMAGLVFVVGHAPGWVERLTFAGLVLLPIVLLALYQLRPVRVDEDRHPILAWLQRFRNKLHSGLTPLRRPRVLVEALGLTMLAWGLELVLGWLVLRAFHVEGNFVLPLLLLLGVNAAILLPVTPGQIGLYELAATLVLRQAGVDTSSAAMVAIVYHLVHVIPTVILGIYFLSQNQVTVPD